MALQGFLLLSEKQRADGILAGLFSEGENMQSVNDHLFAKMLENPDTERPAFARFVKRCVDLGAVMSNIFDIERHWRNGATPEDLVKMSQSGPC